MQRNSLAESSMRALRRLERNHDGFRSEKGLPQRDQDTNLAPILARSSIAHQSQEKYDECYHLAAQSFVAESFADGFSTLNTNIGETHNMLAALRDEHDGIDHRFSHGDTNLKRI